MHLATLSVTDDDGVSSEPLIIAIDVVNIAPSINPIRNPLPVAEDDEISIKPSSPGGYHQRIFRNEPRSNEPMATGNIQLGAPC